MFKIILNLILFNLITNFNFLSAQTITTFAGNGCLGPDSGYNIPATLACIGYPAAGSFDDSGNYYFAQDFSASRVLKINTSGIITNVAGDGTAGFSGDGGPATLASIVWAYAIVDGFGNIYIPDRDNHRVRKVNSSTGIINTIAGNGMGGHSGDGGQATDATLWPESVCIDKYGNVYVNDSSTWIRKIAITGIITTVAGNGIYGFSGDSGIATSASIRASLGICTDTLGNLLIGCFEGRIRKVNMSTGIITTIAGNGNPGPYLGDGMQATGAQFYPYTIAIDKIGNIFISDYGVGNDRVLKIDTAGIIHTIAGSGVVGSSGDGGLATAADLSNPEGVAIDACGNVFIADDANRRIRKVIFSNTCNLNTLKMNNNADYSVFSIFPNPAHYEITITANAQITEISISNLLGQTVLNQEFDKEKAVVNIEGLPPGLYFVKVNGIWVQKLIKE